MCSRYLLTRKHLDAVLSQLNLPREALEGYRDRFNLPPTASIPIVRQGARGTGPVAKSAHWGLIPSWADDRSRFGASLANARAETLAEKPSFREALRHRRCVIPASGFYEWERRGQERLPWLFALANDRPLYFAGLWETWQDAATGEVIESTTLITTSPNPLLARIHDRMPVILSEDNVLPWLNAPTPPSALLAPYPADHMQSHAVATRVNQIRHDDPACTAPIPAPPPADEQLGWGF